MLSSLKGQLFVAALTLCFFSQDSSAQIGHCSGGTYSIQLGGTKAREELRELASELTSRLASGVKYTASHVVWSGQHSGDTSLRAQLLSVREFVKEWNVSPGKVHITASEAVSEDCVSSRHSVTVFGNDGSTSERVEVIYAGESALVLFPRMRCGELIDCDSFFALASLQSAVGLASSALKQVDETTRGGEVAGSGTDQDALVEISDSTMIALSRGPSGCASFLVWQKKDAEKPIGFIGQTVRVRESGPADADVVIDAAVISGMTSIGGSVPGLTIPGGTTLWDKRWYPQRVWRPMVGTVVEAHQVGELGPLHWPQTDFAKGHSAERSWGTIALLACAGVAGVLMERGKSRCEERKMTNASDQE